MSQQSLKDRYDLNLEDPATLLKLSKEHSVQRAYRTSFGDISVNVKALTHFSAQMNGVEADILMLATKTHTVIDLNGSVNPTFSTKNSIVSGNVVSRDGQSAGSNTGEIWVLLDPKKHKEIRSHWLMKVGVGIYDGKRITGEREDAASSAKGLNDVYLGNLMDLEKKVRWLGPVKEFQFYLTVDHMGNWTWVDESLNLKLSGVVKE